jgi:hypothetical protein
MTNSHEVINLETMAQCLADARMLLREGDMCADTYVSLLEDASQRIRSVLTFVQGLGLELTDEDETEAHKILCHCEVGKAHARSVIFQGGDLDLYLDLQTPSDTLVLEPGSGASGKPNWLVYSYDLGTFREAAANNQNAANLLRWSQNQDAS